METTNTEPRRNKGGLDGKAGPGRPPGPQVKRSRGHIDMERVYKTGPDERADDTPGVASCRSLLREDRAKFLSMLNTMRKEHQARKDKILRPDKAQAQVSQDEGSKRVLELIDQLLTEWEESREH